MFAGAFPAIPELIDVRRRLTVVVVGLAAVYARADVFHLAGGGSIEGQLVGSADGQYEIRTVVGRVRIAADAIERVEASDTPFEEYEQRAAAAGSSAAEQTALAAWCAERGLRSERRRHLVRAVELDPDYAPARRMMGQVRVGGLWVDARRAGSPTAEGPEQKAGDEAGRLARAIQSQWKQRLLAIKRNLLDSQLDRLVEDGRARIRAVRDPLAILPMVQVLSGGDAECRELLITMLSNFPEDEATLNLAVLALVEPNGDLRRLALEELARRNDPRVIEQYRDLVRNGHDAIVARAAEGLGRLGSFAAVPDLIDALTARRLRWVEVPIQRYFWTWPSVFSGVTISVYTDQCRVTHGPEIGVWSDWPALWVEWKSDWQYKRVTVYRTEVLEALRAITGEDFGFERERWRTWYDQVRKP